MGSKTKLRSWKEIAGYLECDVRTALRWEKERGMPVRSIPGGKRRRVFAFVEEIEAWLAGWEPYDPPPEEGIRIAAESPHVRPEP